MLVQVLLVFILFFGLMAIGVLLGRKPLAGSCGGLNQAGLDGECKVCGKKPEQCPEKPANNSKTPSQAFNAMGDTMQPPSRPRFKDPLDF